MTILRHYVMVARPGDERALADALHVLAGKVRPIEGCEGIELYQDADKAERFTFVERWVSVDAHRAGGKALGKEAFAPIMAMLVGPPEAAYLEPRALD
jgi:quinol monooxygenase YgiN